MAVPVTGRRVLILGGTSEARALAAALVGQGLPVMSSLAGRVADPALPVGGVRIGGFGGAAGLAEYLQGNGFSMVVDATHPFAARMTGNAVAACQAVGVPLLRLARPGWDHHPDASQWHWVHSYDDAAAWSPGNWAAGSSSPPAGRRSRTFGR